MIHIIPAVIIQLLLSSIDWWFGALFASGYYLGREMAQAEHRVIQKYYGGRSNMPWYGAFEPRGWNRKALLDWVLPTIVTMIIATFMGLK
jgi:hypothetical protein